MSQLSRQDWMLSRGSSISHTSMTPHKPGLPIMRKKPHMSFTEQFVDIILTLFSSRILFHVAHGGVETNCEAYGESPEHRIISVPKTRCEDPSFSFQLTVHGDSGALLKIWHNSTSATHSFPAENFEWRSAFEVGDTQLYMGPAEFDLH